MKKRRYTEEELPKIAAELAAMLRPGSLVTFTGLLGAGKTTLIQALGKQLGVKGVMQSPTYGYVGVYALEKMTVYHFDLYRISGADDFEALGFMEYINDPRGICLIEWAERIGDLLVHPRLAGRVMCVSLDYCSHDLSVRFVSCASAIEHARVLATTSGD